MTLTNTYVRQLKEEQQIMVRWLLDEALTYEGLQGKELNEAIENAMDSRLEDLEEIIELEMIV